MDLLEQIRNKPAHKKTQYAFLGATTVTLLVALVWMSTLPARLNSIEITAVNEEKSPSDLSGFLTDTKEQLGNVIGTIQEEQTKAGDEVVNDSALSQLSMSASTTASSTTTTSLSTDPSIVYVATSSPVIQDTLKDISETASSTTQYVAPQPLKRVILIATTTSQKLE